MAKKLKSYRKSDQSVMKSLVRNSQWRLVRKQATIRALFLTWRNRVRHKLEQNSRFKANFENAMRLVANQAQLRHLIILKRATRARATIKAVLLGWRRAVQEEIKRRDLRKTEHREKMLARKATRWSRTRALRECFSKFQMIFTIGRSIRNKVTKMKSELKSFEEITVLNRIGQMKMKRTMKRAGRRMKDANHRERSSRTENNWEEQAMKNNKRRRTKRRNNWEEQTMIHSKSEQTEESNWKEQDTENKKSEQSRTWEDSRWFILLSQARWRTGRKMNPLVTDWTRTWIGLANARFGFG